MDEKQLKELIKRIVLEVIRRLTGFGACRAIALVPGYSAYAAEAAEYLAGKLILRTAVGDAEASGLFESRTCGFVGR